MKNFFVFIVVIGLIGLGVSYTFSDVYKTKIDEKIDQFAHWTPQNIAKDPESYLTFCEGKINQFLEELKASEIDVSQKYAQVRQMADTTAEKTNTGVKMLAELKEAYKSAEKANAWPMKWNGKDFSQDLAKRQIIALSKEIDNQKAMQVKCEDGIKRLDAQKLKIQDSQSKAQQQIAVIKTNKQMVKIDKISDDLANKLVDIKGAVESMVNISTKNEGIITLNELAKDQETKVDDSEFKKIMERK